MDTLPSTLIAAPRGIKNGSSPAPFDHNQLILGVKAPSTEPPKARLRLAATVEQESIHRFAERGIDLSINAFAGAGKTSTAVTLAERVKRKSFYLTFSQATAHEASLRFPRSVRCTTFHALAYSDSEIGKRCLAAGKAIGNPSLSMIQQLLGLCGSDSAHAAWAVRETVAAFSHDAEGSLERHHIPESVLAALQREACRHIKDPEHIDLHVQTAADVVTMRARELWRAMTSLSNRVAPLSHDAYLKLWVLSRPTLPAEMVLVDEAQDCSSVMVDLIARQSFPKVMLGDRHQSIFKFRGAVDGMSAIGGTPMALTQSFRFGPVIELVANAILKIKKEPLWLCGAAQSAGEVAESSVSLSTFLSKGRATALTRTNSEALAIAIAHLRLRPTAVLGGVDDLLRLLSSALALQEGRLNEVWHPILKPFVDWGSVVSHAQSTADSEIRRLVGLVDDYGTRLAAVIRDLQTRLVPEAQAELLIATAHKAKGREWDRVFMADDFNKPFDALGTQVAEDEELNLLYVASTRARQELRINDAVTQVMDRM